MYDKIETMIYSNGNIINPVLHLKERLKKAEIQREEMKNNENIKDIGRCYKENQTAQY